LLDLDDKTKDQHRRSDVESNSICDCQ